MACVAMLKSRCGEWHFFDLAALQVATTSFAMLCVELEEPTHVVDNDAGVASAGHTVHLPQQRRVELLDGFSIEQWASYAKRKARIATTICKENGALKAKLNARGGDPCNIRGGHDGVFENDPWSAASSNFGRRTGDSTVSTWNDSGKEAWSNWHGTSEVAKVQDLADPDCNDGAECSAQAQHSGRDIACATVKSAPQCDSELEDAVEQNAVGNDGNVSIARSNMIKGSCEIKDHILDDIVQRAFERQEAQAKPCTKTDKIIEQVMRASETRMDNFCNEVRKELFGTS